MDYFNFLETCREFSAVGSEDLGGERENQKPEVQDPSLRMPTHKRGGGARPKPWRALHPHGGPHPPLRATDKNTQGDE